MSTNMHYTSDEMSPRSYNLTIGFTLLWGFVLNLLMCIYGTPFFLEWNPITVIISYLILAIVGITMSVKSDSAFISFIGYNLVVVPSGVTLSIILSQYNIGSILNAVSVTAIVTFSMIIMATFFPDTFLSFWKVLSVSLGIVIICELIFLIIGFNVPTIWDALVALIFCGYIGYDWAVAQKKPKTLNNAIDSVVELYLDIINFLIRILEAIADND